MPGSRLLLSDGHMAWWDLPRVGVSVFYEIIKIYWSYREQGSAVDLIYLDQSFPRLGSSRGWERACVRADVLLCVHSHARRRNNEREKNHRSAINHAAPRI